MTGAAYKILLPDAWAEAQRTGTVAMSGVDVRDGYFHLSAANQVAETVARYFADAEELVLVAFDLAALGAAVRWEPSRGGALFPHVYGALSLAAATSVLRLKRGDGGGFVLPPLA